MVKEGRRNVLSGEKVLPRLLLLLLLLLLVMLLLLLLLQRAFPH